MQETKFMIINLLFHYFALFALFAFLFLGAFFYYSVNFNPILMLTLLFYFFVRTYTSVFSFIPMCVFLTFDFQQTANTGQKYRSTAHILAGLDWNSMVTVY